MPVIPNSTYRMDYVRGSSTTLVAATSSGMMRSTDTGVTWQIVWNGNPTEFRLHPTHPDTMYAVANGFGFLRSTNGGVTWGTVPGSTGLPAGNLWRRASLDICRDAPRTIVVMIADTNSNLQGIWRTVNGGQTWTEITGDLPDIGGTQMFHAQAVAIAPDNPQRIYAGSTNLARTLNGGTNWTLGWQDPDFDSGHADQTQLLIAEASGDSLLWICNDGGIYLHNHAASTTLGMNGNATTGLRLSQIDFISSRRTLTILGLQDNGSIKSTDTGNTWNALGSGDGAMSDIADPESYDFWYWLGVPFDLLRVLNNGNPVNMQQPSNSALSLFYDPFDDRLYVPTRTEVYSMPANGSPGSWTLEPVGALHPETHSVGRMWGSKADGKTFYFRFGGAQQRDVSVARWTGSGWSVHVTEDLVPAGGFPWTITPSSEWQGEAWAGCISAPDSAKIFLTTDFGMTWEDRTGGLTGCGTVYAIALTPFDPLTVYAGTQIGIFKTTDGGQTWLPFQTGMPVVQCKDLKFVVDPTSSGNHKLVAATYGLGLWTRDVPAAPIVYIDKAHTGTENGSIEYPYNTVTEAISAAPAGAILALRSNDYQEPQTISKNLRLVTWSGTSRLH